MLLLIVLSMALHDSHFHFSLFASVGLVGDLGAYNIAIAAQMPNMMYSLHIFSFSLLFTQLPCVCENSPPDTKQFGSYSAQVNAWQCLGMARRKKASHARGHRGVVMQPLLGKYPPYLNWSCLGSLNRARIGTIRIGKAWESSGKNSLLRSVQKVFLPPPLIPFFHVGK